jgi:phosphopantothenoylcysteine decarboxylase/phosphopantothenate--cysteine ligase
MGFALAEAARNRGAQVTVIAGSTNANAPAGVKLICVVSAKEMYEAVASEIGAASVFIGAAAVSDYRPAQRAEEKIKKSHESLTLTLERTTDILNEVSAHRKDGLLVIGFAAETENVIDNARNKLQAKKLDAIVANDVSRTDSGFEVENNSITIIRRDDNTPIEYPLMSKREAADRILDEIVALRKSQAPRARHKKQS